MKSKEASKSKDLPGKPKKGLWVAGGALVVGAGAAAFLWTRNANAADSSGENSGKSGGSSGKKPGGSKGPGGNGGGDGGGDGGGSGGSGGGGSKKPTKDTDPADANKEKEGYFWGDPGKIPEDFDYTSNKIYVSPDCSSVAVGYWFFAEGTDAEGKSTRVPMSTLVDAISDDSDERVRAPRPNFNGVGPEADLIGILAEAPKRTAYTWVGEYYGGIASAPAHSSTALAEDMLRQASMRTGGNDCVGRRDLWSQGMWDFIGFLASRLDEFRRAAYGAQAFGG